MRLIALVAALWLFAMLATTLSDVFGRYFFNSPISGGAEIVSTLLGLTIFTAFPLITRNEGHIKVALLEGKFRGRLGFGLRVVVLIGTVAVVIWIAWLLYLQAEGMRRSNFLTPQLDLPQAPLVYVLSLLVFASGIILLVVTPLLLRRKNDQ